MKQMEAYLTVALFPYGYRAVLIQPTEDHPRGIPVGVSGVFQTLEDAVHEANEWARNEKLAVKAEGLYKAHKVPWSAAWISYISQNGSERRKFLAKLKPMAVKILRRVFKAAYHMGIEEGYMLALKENAPNLNVKH